MSAGDAELETVPVALGHTVIHPFSPLTGRAIVAYSTQAFAVNAALKEPVLRQPAMRTVRRHTALFSEKLGIPCLFHSSHIYANSSLDAMPCCSDASVEGAIMIPRPARRIGRKPWRRTPKRREIIPCRNRPGRTSWHSPRVEICIISSALTKRGGCSIVPGHEVRVRHDGLRESFILPVRDCAIGGLMKPAFHLTQPGDGMLPGVVQTASIH